METVNDKDLKSHPTAIVEETDLSRLGENLEQSPSSSSDSSSEHSVREGTAHDGGFHGIRTADNGGVLEPGPIEASTIEKSKIETNNFDDMIRLDSSSSTETEKYQAESSNSANFQEINGPKLKPDDSNQTDIATGEENGDETSSDDEDNPLDYFQVKSASSSSSQSEAPHQKKTQSDVLDHPLQATDYQNQSTSNLGETEADLSKGKKPISSFSASSSSSSDPDSSNEENIQLSSKETGKSKSDDKLASDLSDDDIPISSMPSEGQPPTQSPPTQVMERNEDPSSSPYRIPSHIFARNKSNTPAEWSTASNESLFSIHMGNNSFSRDQLCWLGKSGELCKPGEAIAPPWAELSTSQPPPSFKPKEIDQNLDEEPVVTEATAAETMREVIRESAENRNQRNTVLAEAESRSANHSQRSDGSTKSFAFPILTGDGEKSVSTKGAGNRKQHSQSPPPSQPPTPKNSNSVPASKPTKAGFQMRWFSCLSCCPFSLRKRP